LSREFDGPACCIIKHTNPCGTAVGESLREAYVKAYEADPVSAFGSIIALNNVVDAGTATELAKLFVEAIIAPGYGPEALSILSSKKNLRVLAAEPIEPDKDWARYEMKRVAGGILIQEIDGILLARNRELSRLAGQRKGNTETSSSRGEWPNTSNPTLSSWQKVDERWAWEQAR